MRNLKCILSDDLGLALNMNDEDTLNKGSFAYRIFHDQLLSDGAVDTVLSNENCAFSIALAFVTNGKEKRVIATYNSRPQWKGGGVIWLRGTNYFHSRIQRKRNQKGE